MDISSVVAKMQCRTIDSTKHSPMYIGHKVRLGAIYGKEGESKDFFDATPFGEFWLQINADRPGLAFFEPGKKYYVTFTEAPD
jgi:hypothetical protein